jgi:hypothetical protein
MHAVKGKHDDNDKHHGDRRHGDEKHGVKAGHANHQPRDEHGNCPPPPNNQPCPDGQPRNAQGNCPAPPNNQPCPDGQARDANGNCPAANNVVNNNVAANNPAPAAPAPAPGAAPAPTGTNVVAGTQVANATARLRTQSRCGTRTVRVTISGPNIRRVTFRVAGRVVRTVTVPAGRRSLTVNLPVRRFGARRQSVTARVTFRNGAAPRTLTASATRCAQGAVSPQFTG